MSWTITTINTLSGGTTNSARAINDLGDIIGYSDKTGGSTHAFLRDHQTGLFADLGTLPSGTFSKAYGINSSLTSLTIVGDADDQWGNTHAFLYDVTMHDLGTLEGMGQYSGESHANGVDDVGTMVGKSNFTTGSRVDFYAFWDDGTTMHQLPRNAGPLTYYDSYANAIDNESPPLVVGAADGYPDTTNCPNIPAFKHAYQWTASSPTTEGLIGTTGSLPNGEEAHAFAINGGGVVAGDSSINYECGPMPTPHAFVAVPRSGGGYTYIQLDSGVSWINQSRAYGINGSTTSYKAVGDFLSPGPEPQILDGFLYDGTQNPATISKLTTVIPSNSGWTDLVPYAINSSDNIVGVGHYNGVYRAFWMYPTAGPNGSGGSDRAFLGGLSPTPLVEPPGLLLSEVQTNAALGPTGLASPALPFQEQPIATAQSDGMTLAANVFPPHAAPNAADPVLAAPGLEATGDWNGEDNGLAALPLG